MFTRIEACICLLSLILLTIILLYYDEAILQRKYNQYKPHVRTLDCILVVFPLKYGFIIIIIIILTSTDTSACIDIVKWHYSSFEFLELYKRARQKLSIYCYILCLAKSSEFLTTWCLLFLPCCKLVAQWNQNWTGTIIILTAKLVHKLCKLNLLQSILNLVVEIFSQSMAITEINVAKMHAHVQLTWYEFIFF